MNFTAIILAGGQSSRMGANKALVEYMGRPLIEYAIDLARLFTNDILLIANNHDLDFLGIPVVSDEYTVKAPLAGIHAGLKSGSSAWNLVLSCDMPNLTKELIEKLLSLLDDDLRMVVQKNTPVYTGGQTGSLKKQRRTNRRPGRETDHRGQRAKIGERKKLRREKGFSIVIARFLRKCPEQNERY